MQNKDTYCNKVPFEEMVAQPAGLVPFTQNQPYFHHLKGSQNKIKIRAGKKSMAGCHHLYTRRRQSFVRNLGYYGGNADRSPSFMAYTSHTPFIVERVFDVKLYVLGTATELRVATFYVIKMGELPEGYGPANGSADIRFTRQRLQQCNPKKYWETIRQNQGCGRTDPDRPVI